MAKSKIKLNQIVHIDGRGFEAGVYDESEIGEGYLGSMLLAGWAVRVAADTPTIAESQLDDVGFDADAEGAASEPKVVTPKKRRTKKQV